MMRYVSILVGSVVLTGITSAGDKSKANSLSAKEIRAGWILLFDGESTFGWDGPAKVKDGMLVVGPQKKLAAATLMTRFPMAELTWEQANNSKRSKGDPEFWTGKQFTKASESIQFHAFENTTTRFRIIKLRPLAMKPLFNGKDLKGWKVLPGYKSKFTVTEEGWLNVKNGRGDIQTTKSFKNFVLQLECISHGKHLNSGIFFRCLPGLYQQGYEAQIRNEANPEKPRTYELPKYDPTTHKKVGTMKIKSTAVDFGTGGIYRRMPARRVVSKDKEWFTMTIVAHGNHFATWVNGIQVADWTDNRPIGKNGRTGCCLNAGVIAIQGHDPTTNLSFRNIRIAEFPAAAKKSDK